MYKRLLSKNIKVTFVTEAEAKAKGLSDTEKVQKESGKFNKQGLEDGYAKLSDLYKFDEGEENALENPPKTTRSEELDVYDVEAKGAGKMPALKYDNEDTENFKTFMERLDALNDTSEYDKEFGTHDGFGGEGEKDNVYNELGEAGEKYKDYKYGEMKNEVEEEDYQRPRPVRAIADSKKVTKESVMKRLNFKQSFNDDKHVLSLIPENYKEDNHIFLMTDGNETYKVRWEGDNTLGEGVILQYQNKERINEDMVKMKRLFNYKSSDVVGKTNNYISETVEFKKMMDIVSGKEPINEEIGGKRKKRKEQEKEWEEINSKLTSYENAKSGGQLPSPEQVGALEKRINDLIDSSEKKEFLDRIEKYVERMGFFIDDDNENNDWASINDTE